MAPGLQDNRTIGEKHAVGAWANFDDIVAELTEAAYPVALRHKAGAEWLDLELDLWKAMAQTVKKWEVRSNLPLA